MSLLLRNGPFEEDLFADKASHVFNGNSGDLAKGFVRWGLASKTAMAGFAISIREWLLKSERKIKINSSGFAFQRFTSKKKARGMPKTV
jgi:hypothetical protein